MAGDTTSTSNLTAREVEILCAMCKAMKSKPEVDMQLFATLAGFSTPASATTNLAKVLKKAKAVGPASSEASKTGSARKRKAAAADSNEEEAAETSPSKTTKKKKKKKKKSGSGKGKASAEAEEGVDVLVKDEKEGSEGADELA